MSAAGQARSDVLLDVTRLIWRSWRGRYPTGIDRVCLAYVVHYRHRALAVIQRRGGHLVLSRRHSARLFALLVDGAPSRWRLVRLLAAAIASSLRPRDYGGAFYLNVGHTGLDEPSLPSWILRSRLRAIFLLHDLIPLTHPQYCRPGEAPKHERRMRNLLASAHGVIGNSQATLVELEAFGAAERLPMPASVVAWICGPPPRRPAGPPPMTTPYFVTLGTIEGRKNHLLLLRAWQEIVARAGDDAPTLVIIGQRGWEAERVFAMLDDPSSLGGKVIERSRCDDEELASWLGGARALLMPSFAEGFGLPIVEALQVGTPVIASKLGVFEEIAGDIPTFIDPDDLEQWVARVREFVGDGAERRRQCALMAAYRAPNWSAHFAAVDHWLETL